MEDFNKALAYSLLLLKYRARSRQEISFRLKKKGYAGQVIEEVLGCLEKNKYLNDSNLTDLYIAQAIEKEWGPKKIDFHLRRLGISPELRSRVYLQKDLWNKKLGEIVTAKLRYQNDREPKAPMKKLLSKIVRLLISRGFEREDIINELRQYQDMSNEESLRE